MFGEPKDVEGECNARLFVADNYGDNHVTFRCMLLNGHPGKHVESWLSNTATVKWLTDERVRCDTCLVLTNRYVGCACEDD